MKVKLHSSPPALAYGYFCKRDWDARCEVPLSFGGPYVSNVSNFSVMYRNTTRNARHIKKISPRKHDICRKYILRMPLFG